MLDLIDLHMVRNSGVEHVMYGDTKCITLWST